MRHHLRVGSYRLGEERRVQQGVILSEPITSNAKWAKEELGLRAKGKGTEAALCRELADLKKEIEDPKRKAAERRKRIVTAAATFAATAVALALIQVPAFGFQTLSPAHWSALAAHGFGGMQHGLPLALSFIGAWWAWRWANVWVCDKLRVPLHEGGQARTGAWPTGSCSAAPYGPPGRPSSPFPPSL